MVADLALAVVLVMGAGLMLRSFASLQQVEPGFRPAGLLTFRLFLPAETYPDGARRSAFFSQLHDRLLAVPGVTNVTAMSGLPPRRRMNANTRARPSQTLRMKTNSKCYQGYRFPPEIISHGVWLYNRFCLSFRDVEELLTKRGIIVSYETIRQWCRKFGPEYARNLKRRQGRLGDVWHLDEVFMKIRGERHCLWRAVDQEDGDVIDILVQRYRNARAAKRFFRKLLKGAGEHGVATGDGQVKKLRRRPPEHYAFRGSQHGTLREQSG